MPMILLVTDQLSVNDSSWKGKKIFWNKIYPSYVRIGPKYFKYKAVYLLRFSMEQPKPLDLFPTCYQNVTRLHRLAVVNSVLCFCNVILTGSHCTHRNVNKTCLVLPFTFLIFPSAPCGHSFLYNFLRRLISGLDMPIPARSSSSTYLSWGTVEIRSWLQMAL